MPRVGMGPVAVPAPSAWSPMSALIPISFALRTRLQTRASSIVPWKKPRESRKSLAPIWTLAVPERIHDPRGAFAVPASIPSTNILARPLVGL
jgi:hypothetical protein